MQSVSPAPNIEDKKCHLWDRIPRTSFAGSPVVDPRSAAQHPTYPLHYRRTCYHPCEWRGVGPLKRQQLDECPGSELI